MNYTFKGYNKEHMARAYGESLEISTKFAVETCRMIRGKRVERAKRMLSEVIAMKKAVPFKRRHGDMSHQTGIGIGRFPIKCCKAILILIESAEKNAQFAGLDTANLIIKNILAHKAATPLRYGRKRGRHSKRTHVEIVLEEAAKKEEEKGAKKGVKSAGTGKKAQSKKE